MKLKQDGCQLFWMKIVLFGWGNYQIGAANVLIGPLKREDYQVPY